MLGLGHWAWGLGNCAGSTWARRPIPKCPSPMPKALSPRPPYDLFIEVVHAHAGVEHNLLCIDAAAARAQHEGDGVGDFLRFQTLLAQRGFFGVQVAVQIA